MRCYNGLTSLGVATAQGRARLANFFQSTGAVSYIITGHTDSRASDAYNMRLSYNRANSVARVANQVGAKIADVRGYGDVKASDVVRFKN